MVPRGVELVAFDTILAAEVLAQLVKQCAASQAEVVRGVAHACSVLIHIHQSSNLSAVGSPRYEAARWRQSAVP